MTILVCGNCGYVGGANEAVKTPWSTVQDNVKPGLYKIWKDLEIYTFVCPRCKSQHIGYLNIIKKMDLPMPTEPICIPTVWVDHSELPALPSISKSPELPIIELSQEPEQQEEDKTTESSVTVEPVEPIESVEPTVRAVRKRAAYEATCDRCGAPFTSKTKGATRCDDCLAKTLRGLTNG